MYKIVIGEINEAYNGEWIGSNDSADDVINPVLIEKDCDIGTLPLAAKLFRDETQLDWGIFAWKAFKSDISRFFKRKGIPDKELESFDSYKEYGVVYIDK